MTSKHRIAPKLGLLLCCMAASMPVWGQQAPTAEAASALPAPPAASAPVATADDAANTIVVTASRGHHAPDRQSYDISSPDSGTLQVEDAVARLPGAIIDIDGTLSILGEKQIFYTLNDEFVSADLARNLPASMIARIEVISNPGAASSNRPGIIINLVLADAEQSRAARIIIADAQADSRDRYEASLTYRLDSGVWNMMASANGEWRDTPQGSAQRDSFPGTTDFISDDSVSRNQNGQYSGNLVVGRELAADQRLSTLCNINGGNDRQSATLTHIVSLAPAAQAQRDIESRARFDNLGWGCTLGFSFAKRGESDYSLNLSYTRFDRDQDLAQNLTGDLGNSRFFYSDSGRSNYFSAEAKRVIAYNRRERLEFGGAWSVTDGVRDYRFTDTAFASSRTPNTAFASENREASGFLTYQFPIGSLDIKAGVRLSSRQVDLMVDGADIVGGPRRTRLLPSLHLEYKPIQSVTIRASVAEHFRPFIEDYYNPALLQSEYNTFQIGNADLDIPLNINTEFSVEYIRNRRSILSKIYVRDNEDSIFTLTDFTGNDQFTSHFVNTLTDTRYGFNLNIKYPLSGRILLTTDVDIFRQIFRWDDRGLRETDRTSWMTKLNLDWQLDSNDAVLLVGQYQGPRFQFNQARSEALSSSLKYTHDFPRNLSLALEAVNFLASDSVTSIFDTPTLHRESATRTPQSGIRLNLTKRF